MKRFFLIPLFYLGVLGACSPADQARDACQDLLDQTVPGIVADIEEQCQQAADEASQQCSETIDQAIDEMKAWADQKLKDAEHEAFVRAGCVEDASPLGWDCTASLLCK